MGVSQSSSSTCAQPTNPTTYKHTDFLAMTTNTLIEELRELLYAEPSTEAWQAILDLFETHDTPENLLFGVAYAQQHLDGWPDELRTFGGRRVPVPPKQPHLAWPLIRNLGVSEHNLKAADLAKMCASPLLAQLTHLDLSYNKLGPDGAKALAECKHLGALTSLNLGRSQIGDKGAIALAASDALPALKELNLGRAGLKSSGARALLASPLLEGLHSLELDRNGLGVGGAKALANNHAAASLQTLGVANCNLTDSGLRSLLASKHLTALEHLDLTGNGLTQLDPLVDSSVTRGLKVLDLSDNPLDHQLATLARAPLDNLIDLDLTYCPIAADEVEAFASATWLPRLQRLRAHFAPPNGELRHPALLHVPLDNLRALQVPRMHLLDLVDLLDRLPLLEVLDCGNVDISGVDDISNVLASQPRLETLPRFSPVDGESDPARLKALVTSPGLSHIKKLEIPMRSAMTTQILTAMANNPALRALESLALKQVPLDVPSLRALVNSPNLTSLESLAFSFCQLRPQEIQTLALCTGLGALRSLSLPWTGELDAKHVASLVEAPGLEGLEELRVDRAKGDFEVWDVLVKRATPLIARRFLAQRGVEDLRNYAKHLKLKGISKLHRLEIVEAVLAHVGQRPV